ncbi:unnamed protein product [Blepharisma stoltei]|uniref:Transmembrane protein 107 n=1 Tax=Blepharisma stoltei TaxID=1481888 RepID=A0AAU9K2H8_9CILI|nr:unnamed protein product [Blepharisma stoltei]
MVSITDKLISIKFIACISQLFLTIVVAYVRAEILRSNYDEDGDNYSNANTSLVVCVVLSFICLVFEILVLLSGLALFYDKINVFEVLLHSLGTLFVAWFILDKWNPYIFWVIWGFLALIPFLLELLIVISSRKLFKVT